MKFDRTKMIEALRQVVQRLHYPLEVMLVCVRWYAAYPLSHSAQRFNHLRTVKLHRLTLPARAYCDRTVELVQLGRQHLLVRELSLVLRHQRRREQIGRASCRERV